MKYKFRLATVFFLTLCSGWVSADIKKVMLVVNYGDGTAIEHIEAVPSFVSMVTALSTEHAFTLTVTKKGDARRSEASRLDRYERPGRGPFREYREPGFH